MPKPQKTNPSPEAVDSVTDVESVDERDPTVVSLLGLSPGGKPKPTRRALIVILENDPEWKGRLRRDRFRNALLLDGEPIVDETVTRVAYRMEEIYGASPAKELLYECMSLVGSQNGYHAVRDWSGRLAWDGTERLPTLLTEHFGAPDDPLTREISRIWLVGGAARVMEPGCKLDTVTILVGEQGIGKSRACRALMPDPSWFADTRFDLGSKDAMQNLGGVWLYEIAELDALRGRSAERVKAFLSSSVDTYRVPYGRIPGQYPRQCFFVGTTNEAEFLDDTTGARRFLPVRVTRIDLATIAKLRDQLWAEAFARHARGEAWHLAPQFEKAQRAAAAAFERSDPLAERLTAWVLTVGRAFTAEEAISCGYGIPPERMDHALRTKLGTTLARLGCRKFRPRRTELGRGRVWLWEPPETGDEK